MGLDSRTPTPAPRPGGLRGPVALPRPATATGRSPLARRTPAGLEPNATLVDRDVQTPTIVRLRIRPDTTVPAFRAGQYLAIGLPVDGRMVQRPYSMASPPDEAGDLEFLVRLVPAGSLTPRLWRLRPGDRVRIGPPKGLFTLDDDDPRQHLLLATGTGIAPLRAMVMSLVAHRASPRPGTRFTRPPIVIHGVATVPELVYRDQLEHLSRDGAIGYVPAISRPADPGNDGWLGPIGRLDALIGRIATEVRLEPSSTVAYLCGNPAMIGAVEPRLVELGLAVEAIRAEHYWTAQP